MTKKKREEKIVEENLTVLSQIKEQFLTLCKQYEHMGLLFKIQSKAMSHSMFAATAAPAAHKRIVEQYMQIGEQLKGIGRGLDSLGGKSVLEEQEKKEGNKGDKKTFVSNIQLDISGKEEK